MGATAGAETKLRQRIPIAGRLNIEITARVDPAPETRNLRGVAPDQIEHEALEV
jgi:hypothetical protein